MKKLLMGAIILFLFAASIALVEVSCTKVMAKPLSPTTGYISKILFVTPAINTINGTDTTYAGGNIYVCNRDGSNIQQVPIPFPSSEVLISTNSGFTTCLSPNADSVIFEVATGNLRNTAAIYTCALDGTGLRTILSTSSFTVSFPILCDVK